MNIHDLFGFIIDKERKRVRDNLARARKRGLAATLALVEWLTILNRFKYQCAYCQGPFETMEHVIPLGWGAGTTANNVVPCCRQCNQQYGQVMNKVRETRQKLAAV